MIRDLTPQEIQAAPDWATHYLVNDDSALLFESDNYFMYAGDGFKWSQTSGVSKLALPIPRKEFDIKPYKHWCDPCDDSNGPDGFCYYVDLNRDKAIEIAKHFKLI